MFKALNIDIFGEILTSYSTALSILIKALFPFFLFFVKLCHQKQVVIIGEAFVQNE